MSSKVPSQAELEANRAALEKRNANLEKLKAKALSNGSTNTANEYQRMIDEDRDSLLIIDCLQKVRGSPYEPGKDTSAYP